MDGGYTAGPRLGVIWCPDWPVVAAGAAREECAAVLRANRVIGRTPAAAAVGVRQGHRRREAQRICPQLRLIDHDPGRDGREFEVAVRHIADMVPRVEVTEPGLLTFAARGPSRYFGGEEVFAAKVIAGLAEVLPAAIVGVGVADGRFAAGIAARQASNGTAPLIVPAGLTATFHFLQDLSVELLRDVAQIEAEFIELLQRLGIRRLRELAALPPADLLARFGHQGVIAHRLASGSDDRPPSSIIPALNLAVSSTFEEPVQVVEPLVFAAKSLAQQLAASLAAEGRVCTRLAVIAETEYGERNEHLWYRPSGLSVAAMVERVRWQLDGWIRQPGGLSGGVTLLRLEPDEIHADDGSQLGFWGERTEADEWAVRATARVVALLGEQHVFFPARSGGRQPGDMIRWVSADRGDVTEPADRLVATTEPWPGLLPSPSPTVVLHQPLPAVVTDQFGVTVSVSGRGGISAAPAWISIDGGRQQMVSSWAGPWPLDERWWDAARHRRMARFQLLTEAGSALLVAVEHQQWWVTGLYR